MWSCKPLASDILQVACHSQAYIWKYAFLVSMSKNLKLPMSFIDVVCIFGSNWLDVMKLLLKKSWFSPLCFGFVCAFVLFCGVLICCNEMTEPWGHARCFSMTAMGINLTCLDRSLAFSYKANVVNDCQLAGNMKHVWPRNKLLTSVCSSPVSVGFFWSCYDLIIVIPFWKFWEYLWWHLVWKIC